MIKYQAPYLSPEFIDYIVQKISKNSTPFFYIIVSPTKRRRNDTSITNPEEYFKSAIETRDALDNILIVQWYDDLLNIFDHQPDKHTIVIIKDHSKCNSFNASYIGLVYDKFHYNIKSSIIPKLNPNGNEAIECFCTLSFFKEKPKKTTSKKVLKELNEQPRLEAIQKAYNKKNTIIYEIISAFKENNFNPLSNLDLKNKIPSIVFSNYNVWDRQHARYKLLKKENNKWMLDDFIISHLRFHE